MRSNQRNDPQCGYFGKRQATSYFDKLKLIPMQIKEIKE